MTRTIDVSGLPAPVVNEIERLIETIRHNLSAAEIEAPLARELSAIPRMPARLPPVSELAAEQGVILPQDVNKLMGLGVECWDSDEEFDEFLKWLESARPTGV